MRKPKTWTDKKKTSLPKDTLDLDPTTNRALGRKLFRRLIISIEKQKSVFLIINQNFNLIRNRKKKEMINNSRKKKGKKKIPLSKERKFGQSLRRLLKLVSLAYLNPSESWS